MAEKNYRTIEKWLPEKMTLPKIDYGEKWNEDIVETAGFIPLEVRFKQMEQAGFQAQFFEQEFSSKDVRDMYLNHPEFDITGEDDIEEALEKIELRREYIESVKQAIRQRNASEDFKGSDVNAPSQKESKKDAANEVKDNGAQA